MKTIKLIVKGTNTDEVNNKLIVIRELDFVAIDGTHIMYQAQQYDFVRASVMVEGPLLHAERVLKYLRS